MKQVFNYQEIGTLIDQGKQVVFTCYPQARVTAIQRHPDSDTVTVTLNLSIRETRVGMVTYEYTSMLAVLDAFDIEDLAEIWELVDEEEESFRLA
jgi:hypothetical protein